MDAQISVNSLMQIGAIIAGIYGSYKVVMEIIKAITDRHDREQKWDESAKVIHEEREKIVKRYDVRLSELETKIDENHCDTEAKIQEIRSELFILTECMRAVLDGLHQQGCNGEVTKAREKLDTYLVRRAHEFE